MTWNNTSATTHSVVAQTGRNSPAARNYSSDTGSLELNMASGTYRVRAASIVLTVGG